MRKRATKLELEKRVQIAFDLMTKRDLATGQIVSILMNKEHVSERTAMRIVKKAKQLTRELGSQPWEVERGILNAKLKDVYALERNKPNPDTKVLNQLIKTGIELSRTHSYLSGGKGDDHTSQGSTRDTLSPELEALFNGLQEFDADSEKP